MRQDNSPTKTMSRNRPQPPAPDSWHNPTPRQLVEATDPTPLQQEIIADIEDLQRHLSLILERVKADEPIGGALAVKTARINFLLGKYQYSQDLRAENLAVTEADDPGYQSSGYQSSGYKSEGAYPQPLPPVDYNYKSLGYDAASKLPPDKFQIWQKLTGEALNAEETDH